MTQRPQKPPSSEEKAGASSRLVLGMQPVREAIRVHQAAVEEVWVQQGDQPRWDALARFARDQGIQAVRRLPRSALDRRSKGARHQGVLALAPPLKLHDLDDVALTGGPLVLLDGVTDPQNFGAVIRGAVALGAAAVVFGEHHAAPLSPATFRASAGAVEHATLVQVASLRQAVQSLGDRGVATVALDANADQELPELDLTGPCAVVVGAEDTGVGKGVRRACSHRARLPMEPVLDSLNASVAAALSLYEIRRQRL